MDLFDAADYADLVPRKVRRLVAYGFIGFVLLFPSQFQHWYLDQATKHAQHIVKELTSGVDQNQQPPAR